MLRPIGDAKCNYRNYLICRAIKRRQMFEWILEQRSKSGDWVVTCSVRGRHPSIKTSTIEKHGPKRHTFFPLRCLQKLHHPENTESPSLIVYKALHCAMLHDANTSDRSPKHSPVNHAIPHHLSDSFVCFVCISCVCCVCAV